MGDNKFNKHSLIIEIKEIFVTSLLSLKNLLMSYESESVSLSVVSDSATQDSSCPWSSPGKTTRVCCHALLPGISLTQGSNLGLPHCRQMLYRLSHQGSPIDVKQTHLFGGSI